MIQRYLDFVNEGCQPDDDGPWVNYFDHLAEIEKLKPKWIQGQPTEDGNYWVRHSRLSGNYICNIVHMDYDDYDEIIIEEIATYDPRFTYDEITAYCKIQEPEE